MVTTPAVELELEAWMERDVRNRGYRVHVLLHRDGRHVPLQQYLIPDAFVDRMFDQHSLPEDWGV